MIKFTKLYEVKSPERGTPHSAGIDFFIPEFSEDIRGRLKNINEVYFFDEEFIYIEPHGRVLIPSGIKVEIPENTALIAYNKSGIANKLGLDLGASIVDYDYTGELFISLTNTTTDRVKLKYGQKIIQFVLLPILFDALWEVSENALHNGDYSSTRGAGCLGSTGV